MATIEELERQILQLRKEMQENGQTLQALTQKSEKALDTALHAYKVDHYNFIWVWDTEKQGYRKTQMRVCSPEIPNETVTTKKMADGAVTSDKIAEDAVTGDKIAPSAVKGKHIALQTLTAEHIAPGAITHDKLAPECITGDDMQSDIPNGKLANDAVSSRNIQKWSVLPDKLDPELLNLIYSAGSHGIAVANEFGDNPLISVSQKKLTDAFVKVWQKIEDMTGEILQGINMVVTPTFFVSKDGCDVHIAANTVDTNGIFERIQFFVDGEKIYEAENTEYVEPFVYHIDVKDDYNYVVMCKAKIMGIEYTRQQIVTRYNEFYIGAATDYSVLLDPAHASEYAQKLNGTMRHNYDVTFNEGDKLIIVMGASLRPGFIRADLNGSEIEMTEVKLDADGHEIPEGDTTTEVKFIGFMSEAWSAGEYNIDING